MLDLIKLFNSDNSTLFSWDLITNNENWFKTWALTLIFCVLFLLTFMMVCHFLCTCCCKPKKNTHRGYK
ncbi:protein ORF18 [Lake sturgeon herpesvirus]|nr:protein ORF18 [Lake sturgeon herpesvirus]